MLARGWACASVPLQSQPFLMPPLPRSGDQRWAHARTVSPRCRPRDILSHSALTSNLIWLRWRNLTLSRDRFSSSAAHKWIFYKSYKCSPFHFSFPLLLHEGRCWYQFTALSSHLRGKQRVLALQLSPSPASAFQGSLLSAKNHISCCLVCNFWHHFKSHSAVTADY